MALKDLEIRTLKPRERIFKKADEHGLYIEVHPSGSKLWRFKYTFWARISALRSGAILTSAWPRPARSGRRLGRNSETVSTAC